MNLRIAVLGVAVLSACGGGKDATLIDNVEASRLAKAYVDGRAKDSPGKPVADVTSFPDRSGVDALHVVRFKGGGFVVLSADRRLPPVLAYDDDSEFPLGPDVVGPSGLDAWLSVGVRQIERARATHAAPDPAVTELWNRFDSSHSLAPVPSAVSKTEEGITIPPCGVNTISVSPLMTTQWNQGCGYDLDTPVLGCTQSCSHAWTGCEATAAAQVMRYWQYPSGFAWGSMPDSVGCSGACATAADFTPGTDEIASLMSDIGTHVGMSYDCGGSSAYTEDVRNTLVSRYQYAATYADFNWSTVEQEHRSGRPVIHDGFSESCFLFICWPTNGHAWVSDGYQSYAICQNGTVVLYDYLHMNWGWGGAYDGYYSSFTPGGEDLTQYLHMIYGIYPNPPPPPPPPPPPDSCGSGTCGSSQICCGCTDTCMSSAMCRKVCSL